MLRTFRFRLFYALAVVLLAAACEAPRSGRAQEPSAFDASAASDSVTTMMQSMGPAFGMMMENMMEAMRNVLERPETAERLASFARNYYEALLQEGFSEEQALRLTVAIGFPSLTGGN
jgi:hypothetical protein